MKTAVSIPDDVFEAAENLARRTKKSRSRLFSDALKEYVDRRSPEKITQAMDSALAEIGVQDDEFLMVAGRRILDKSGW